MLLNPDGDRDAPENYHKLDELLAGRLDKVLNSYVRKRYTDAIAAAVQMPAGPGRQAVLNALSGGLSSSLRTKDLQAEAEDLRVRLNTEMPQAAELQAHCQKIQAHLGVIHRKFAEAWNADKARGMDTRKTSFAWFEHELNCFTDAIRSALRDVARSGTPRAETHAAKTDGDAEG